MAGLSSDKEIWRRFKLPTSDPYHLRIEPFVMDSVKKMHGKTVIGYGLSGMGYDLRLGTLFRPVGMDWTENGLREGQLVNWDHDPNFLPVVDPKDQTAMAFGAEFTSMRPFVIPPHGCVLGESQERLRLPEDTAGFVMGKSTLARCFLNLNTTLLEPGWEGTVTLEIANLSPLPLMIYPLEGIAQVVFIASDQTPERTYNRRRDAAYQNQQGPTTSRV